MSMTGVTNAKKWGVYRGMKGKFGPVQDFEIDSQEREDFLWSVMSTTFVNSQLIFSYCTSPKMFCC